LIVAFINSLGVWALFIGIVIGIVVTLFVVKWQKFINEIKRQYSKSPIETVVIYVTGVIILINLLSSLINKTLSSSLLNVVLSFFSSFVFSWILTKKTTEISFKEKQKEAAIRSYRHSISIKSKLNYSIKISDLINTDLVTCKGNAHGKCELSDELLRLRDFLITAKMDANDNINDWADILSEELNIIEDIRDNKIKIEKLQMQKQDLNLNDTKEKEKADDLENEISKLLKEIDNLKDKVNPMVRHTLEIEEDFESEYVQHVENEIENKKVKNMHNKIDYNNLQSKNSFSSK
jgi:TRAP-type C4-dicarboxylate transport system, large permease component